MNFKEAIAAALSKRRNLKTDLCRLFDDVGDGVADLVIDRFGPALLIHLWGDSSRRGVLRREILAVLPLLVESLKIRTVYLREHSGSAERTAETNADLVFGSAIEELVVKENQLKAYVFPATQVNAGFFIDMREWRAKLAENSVGKRVLNTFCFSGLLGIAAWLGGASEVVQVDISAGALELARRNLELNQGEQQLSGVIKHIKEDAREYLARMARKAARGDPGFDLVIIDPPTFGRSRGKVFSTERDLESLALNGLAALNGGGGLLITINTRGVQASEIEDLIQQSAIRTGKTIASVSIVQPPAQDFLAATADSRSMRGVFVTLS
jgi:23S rRNA (cytosine1962-C5)-methyltransferase